VGHDQNGTGLFPPARLREVAAATAAAGLDAVLLTPGPDLRYVTGYDAHALERLTCLAVPAEGDPFLVVPRLEVPAAQASPVGQLDLEVIGWDETDDPYALVAGRLGDVAAVGLADRMWALMVLRLRAALPGARQELASVALRDLRARKSPAEVAALLAAGEAIDRVHAQVPGWLRPGRTEREVAADISEAILAEGHVTVDFAIVASGPNGASPHHTAADRVLQPGDAVVVDIGGTMPTGYCSDCTRTYAIGTPPAEFAAYYQVLKDAQEAACAAVRPQPRASRSRRPALVTTSCTGRATASAWRRTRTRTSCPVTPRCSSPGTPSRSSQGSIQARTEPGSRTSWCAPPMATSGSTTSAGN
jgi:Xaa-Pro aminopeptidase